LLIGNSSSSNPGYTLADIKAHFIANSIDYYADYHGATSDTNNLWSKLGADGYIPFNVLIDRDGMVRKIGGAATSADWAAAIKELSGAP